MTSGEPALVLRARRLRAARGVVVARDVSRRPPSWSPEAGQVRCRIGVALLAVVTRDEGGVEVLGSRMRQFVEHPGFGHDPILLEPAACFPVASKSTDIV